MKVLLLVAFFLGCNILVSSGSRIVFTATSQTIDPLTTKNLTLRCALTDSPASSGKDKRSVPVHPMSDRQHAVMKRSSSDAVKHVKSTPNKVLSVSSIVISRNGLDLAKQVIHLDAVRRGSDTRYTVKGKMSDKENYVELVWPHPTGKDAGEFKCEIATAGADGRSLVFSDIVTVEDSAVNNKKLIEHVTNLQAELQELKAKAKPNVLFSADLLSTKGYYSCGSATHAVVYDRVTANVGGAYDASTGVFTAPVSGYYRFGLSAGAIENKFLVNLRFSTSFTANSLAVKDHVPNGYFTSAANTGIYKLKKGTRVHASCSWSIKLKTTAVNTFNGQLIALA